jgi:hypothetical protein
MVSVPVQCPYCQSTEVIKAGKQANGTQRYRCQTTDAHGGSFSCSTRIEAGYSRSVDR